jgi:hypothetical protein
MNLPDNFTMASHDTDDATFTRIQYFLEDERGLSPAQIHLISNEPHPMDTRHSLTTIFIEQINNGVVQVWATWRDRSGGSVQQVAGATNNAAAH